MKLCIDCADEIPEDRVRLDPGTMRCATCQEMHEVDRYERQILQNKLKSNKTGNEKGSAKLPTEKLPNFFICSLCNYKKNQYVDRPCAWCGKTGHINTNLNEEKKNVPIETTIRKS